MNIQFPIVTAAVKSSKLYNDKKPKDSTHKNKSKKQFKDRNSNKDIISNTSVSDDSKIRIDDYL